MELHIGLDGMFKFIYVQREKERMMKYVFVKFIGTFRVRVDIVHDEAVLEKKKRQASRVKVFE